MTVVLRYNFDTVTTPSLYVPRTPRKLLRRHGPLDFLLIDIEFFVHHHTPLKVRYPFWTRLLNSSLPYTELTLGRSFGPQNSEFSSSLIPLSVGTSLSFLGRVRSGMYVTRPEIRSTTFIVLRSLERFTPPPTRCVPTVILNGRPF